MPATRTITSLGATITQAALISALKIAFADAGFSAPVLDITSGTDRILAYAFNSGEGIFGTVHLRIRVTSTRAIFQQLSIGPPSGGTSGTNASSEVSLGTLNDSIPITFNALNGNEEYKLVVLTQASLMFPLGIIAPITRRGSWNLNSWSWGFIFTSSSMSVVRGTALNQFASADYDIALAASGRLGNANPIDNERDVLSSIILLTQSNQGFVGKSSDELAIISANGSTRFDIIHVTGSPQQYLILNPASGGFGVRVA